MMISKTVTVKLTRDDIKCSLEMFDQGIFEILSRDFSKYISGQISKLKYYDHEFNNLVWLAYLIDACLDKKLKFLIKGKLYYLMKS